MNTSSNYMLKSCIYNAIFSVLNKLPFLREKTKIFFSAVKSAPFVVQRQMGRYADNTKNSMGKMIFNIKYIQSILMFSSTFVLEAALVLGLTEWKHSFYHVKEMLANVE